MLSYVGWTIPIILLWIHINSYSGFSGLLFWLIYLVIIDLILISVVIYIIEVLVSHKIKNKFMLNNRFYNIFLLIGISVSISTFLYFIFQLLK